MVHESMEGTKGQKQNDPKRKRTGHEQKILKAALRMMEAKSRFYRKPLGIHCAFCRIHGSRITGDSGQRRDSRSSLCRSTGCQQHGQNTDHGTCSDSDPADAENRQFSKKSGTDVTKQCTKSPDDHGTR